MIKFNDTNWYKKVLLKNAKEIAISGITYTVFGLVLLIWYFLLGIKFQWQHISPLSPPSFFVRAFYSAFTFVTLGWLLYKAYFYKVLHNLLVKTLGLWEVYNTVKAVVWLILMYISYEYIVPWLFDVLNASISVLYNFAGLVLYILPPLGISIILISIYLLIKNKN